MKIKKENCGYTIIDEDNNTLVTNASILKIISIYNAIIQDRKKMSSQVE